jgi:hypothetical protein
MSFKGGWPFDEWDSAEDINRYWGGYYTGNESFSSSILPEGGIGKSMLIPSNGGIRFGLPSNQSGKTMHILWIYRMLSAVDLRAIFHINSTKGAVTPQLTITVDADSGFLKLYRGVTLLATGSTSISPDNFYAYQIEAIIANTGGVLKVNINGNPTPDIDFSGDTQNQATDDVWGIGNSYDGAISIRSGYLYCPIIWNSDGTANNTKIPLNLTHFIQHSSSDGASIWTPNSGADAYPAIDDPLGTSDDNTSYVKTSTLNDKNIVGMGPALSDAGDVLAVQQHARIGRQNIGTAGVKIGTKVGATEQQSAEIFLPSSYIDIVKVHEFKTGTTPFSVADINTPLELTAELTTVN